MAPFAFGGAAAGQQAVAVPAAGGSRWAPAGLVVEGSSGFRLPTTSVLLLLSLGPVVLYLLLALHRAPREGEEGAAEDAGAMIGGGDEPVGRKLSNSGRGGSWVARWSALLGEDTVQVAISSLSAAALTNAFHSPGTARVRRTDLPQQCREGQ